MNKHEAIEFGESRLGLFGGKMEEYIELTVEVLKKQESEDAISRYSVLHKIAEFFSNWDGDENAKMEISVNDMREIADISVKEARAEWQLSKIKGQQPKLGHWVGISLTGYTGKDEKLKYNEWGCSECGMEVSNDYMDFDYCPYCGVRMIEPQAESEET